MSEYDGTKVEVAPLADLVIPPPAVARDSNGNLQRATAGCGKLTFDGVCVLKDKHQGRCLPRPAI